MHVSSTCINNDNNNNSGVAIISKPVFFFGEHKIAVPKKAIQYLKKKKICVGINYTASPKV